MKKLNSISHSCFEKMISKKLRISLTIFVAVTLGFSIASKAVASTPVASLFKTISEKSPEELLVNDGVRRSTVSGKPLLVIISASWCGPCFELHENMKKFNAETDAAFHEFEFIFIEDTYTTRLPYDYVGKQMTGYPSTFIYEPTLKTWTSIPPWTDYTLFLNNLKDFSLNKNNFGDFIWNRFISEVKAGKHFGNDDKSFEIYEVLEVIASSFPTDNVLKKLLEIKELRKNAPDQFKFASEDDFNYLFNWVFRGLFGKEDADLQKMRASIPEAIRDSDLKEDPNTIRNYYFEIVLGKTLRKEGKKATALLCDGIRSDFITHLNELTPKYQSLLKNKSLLFCEELKFITGMISRTDFLNSLNSLSDADKKLLPSHVWNAYVLLDDYASAAPYVELDFKASLSRAGGMGEDAEGAKARVIESYELLKSAHLNLKRNPNVK